MTSLFLAAAFLNSFTITRHQLEAAYATRYWDCCKGHCSWSGNVFGDVSPLGTCNKNNLKQDDSNIVSACQNANPDSAFTCHDNAPWAVSGHLAYGFAAVPATGDICGSCYELTFTGKGQHSDNPGAAALKGKVMIVQASNIGYDVAHEQFDIMIPGGGVGAFDACSYQWNVATSEIGAQYGGFLSSCQQQHGSDAAHEVHKSCVLEKCNNVFGKSKLSRLHDGCKFFVDWFECADNPMLTHRQVACPSELEQVSGMSRASDSLPVSKQPKSTHTSDESSKSPTVPAPTECKVSTCGCSWANAGACAVDDGTLCNVECCCHFRQPDTMAVASTSNGKDSDVKRFRVLVYSLVTCWASLRPNVRL